MNGYIQTPVAPIPVMDVTGTKDTIIPINKTDCLQVPLSSEGWIYSLMTDIFSVWEPVNGCSESSSSQHYPTSFDGVQDLYCWGKSCGDDGEYPVIRCAWSGGHNYYGNSPGLNGPLVWEFLSKFTNPYHEGLGVSTKPHPPRGFIASKGYTEVAEEIAVRAHQTAESSLWNNGSWRHPYGDPKSGCELFESTIQFTIDSNTTAAVCAPKLPFCKVGGYNPTSNGCPQLRNRKTGVTPVCMAINKNNEPHLLERHCLLACNRNRTKVEADPHADSTCPPGAICVPGYQRFGHKGVCLFPQH